MLRPISALLERLAQRCLALGASMLATTFEALQIAHHAEQQNQLEELARTYESEGLTEIASSLREKAKSLSLDRPADRGEALLRELADIDHAPRGVDVTALTAPPIVGGSAGERRINGRLKRGRAPVPAVQNAEGSAPANELFFPLSPPAPTSSDEGQGG